MSDVKATFFVGQPPSGTDVRTFTLSGLSLPVPYTVDVKLICGYVLDLYPQLNII